MKTDELTILTERLKKWLGDENISYFRHLKGLTGSVSPALKLNRKRKGIPIHIVHLREGAQIRNFLRNQKDITSNWNDIDFENNWTKVVEYSIKMESSK